MKRVVADSHIPHLRGLLEPYARVDYLERITAADVRTAHALLVRTRTRCDAALLDGSQVELIGTATIGTDHIDLDYCRSHHIAVANAPGCNAPAVAQWVHATLGHWMRHRGIASPVALTLGVVGVGHVGSIVARWAVELGMRVLLCDPPRAAREGGAGFVTLHELAAQADVITLHTPLTRQGRWPTWHLCDSALLRRAHRCRLLLNAARGEVCSTPALLEWSGDLAIDCWEHEPDISRPLLDKAFVATPHIAGYSLQGKQRGTAMVVEALNAHFGWHAAPVQASTPLLGATGVTLPAVMASYNPLADTAMLRSHPDAFESLRNHYHLRNEVAPPRS